MNTKPFVDIALRVYALIFLLKPEYYSIVFGKKHPVCLLKLGVCSTLYLYYACMFIWQLRVALLNEIKNTSYNICE